MGEDGGQRKGILKLDHDLHNITIYLYRIMDLLVELYRSRQQSSKFVREQYTSSGLSDNYSVILQERVCLFIYCYYNHIRYHWKRISLQEIHEMRDLYVGNSVCHFEVGNVRASSGAVAMTKLGYCINIAQNTSSPPSQPAYCK
jgi:hypothetical protein